MLVLQRVFLGHEPTIFCFAAVADVASWLRKEPAVCIAQLRCKPDQHMNIH